MATATLSNEKGKYPVQFTAFLPVPDVEKKPDIQPTETRYPIHPYTEQSVGGVSG